MIIHRKIMGMYVAGLNLPPPSNSCLSDYITFQQTNQGEALYIINSVGIAYHQHAVLHLIKAQGGIIHGFAVMIYSSKEADDIHADA